jgi:hypothetical protein
MSYVANATEEYSTRFLRSVYSESNYSVDRTKPPAPDITIRHGANVIGFAEVKTVTDELLEELHSGLFGKKRLSRFELPEGSGSWSVYAKNPGTNLREVQNLVKLGSRNGDLHRSEMRRDLNERLRSLGSSDLVSHERSESDLLLITPPASVFQPMTGAFEIDPLLRNVIDTQGAKHSFRLVAEAPELHNHLFLWPQIFYNPALYFKLIDEPRILPSDSPPLSLGFRELWVAHPLSDPEASMTAWRFSKENKWSTVQISEGHLGLQESFLRW